MSVCSSKDILVEPGSLGSGRTITPESIVSPLQIVKKVHAIALMVLLCTKELQLGIVAIYREAVKKASVKFL